MATVSFAPGPSRPAHWSRRYPPLVALAVAFLIALAILPSSLNLPQSNPSTVLEYAPVPPDQEEDIPPAGNVSELGLGSSAGLQGGGAAGGEGAGGASPPPPPPAATQGPLSGGTPRTKRCVGSPPRQTEDPLSPPCVAHFDGDNGGATYQGVRRDEVRILIYAQGFVAYTQTSRGAREVTPDGQYYDLADPADPDEHIVVRGLRLYQQYFNDRYQTYGRFVHFFVYFSTGGSGEGPETRRADAADNFATVKPFAVVSYVKDHADPYLEFMASKGVLNFGSFTGREASFFQRYPKLIWGYYPSIQYSSRLFSSFLCRKVQPHPASFSGNAGQNGRPRKYGLIYTRDPGRDDLRRYKDAVVAQARSCGLTFDAEYQFPYEGFTHDSRATPRYAAEQMADAARRGITTLVWAGGLETNYTKAAASAGYFPEWIIAGDTVIESLGYAEDQHPEEWARAWIVSFVTGAGPWAEEYCYQAAREVNPDEPHRDLTFVHCAYYKDLRQLFIGIQVAGPRLGPTSIDKGFHAIPKIPSSNPRIPACFYEPADYTCTKDAIWEKWDQSADGGAGCYRMADNGRRSLGDAWPAGDVLAQSKGQADPCNFYSLGNTLFLNPGTPEE